MSNEFKINVITLAFSLPGLFELDSMLPRAGRFLEGPLAVGLAGKQSSRAGEWQD
jgi:hypothetical protein